MALRIYVIGFCLLIMAILFGAMPRMAITGDVADGRGIGFQDGVVDQRDLAALASHWLADDPNDPHQILCDFSSPDDPNNPDGIVNLCDFAALARNYLPPSYTISGTVSTDNGGVDGVIMAGLPGNPVTSGGGLYSANVPYNWGGTITPTKSNYSFSPATVSYTGITADLPNRNFAATWTDTIAIYGTTNVDGVTLVGLPGNPTTSGGAYSVIVPPGWSGKVRPIKPSYSFNPPSRTYTNVTTDPGAQNYSANEESTTFTISGTAGVDGVIMNGLPGDPCTNGGGLYSATVPYNWSGTITPTKTGYSFSPASISYTGVTSDLGERNFTITQWPSHTISGTISVDGVVMVGLPGNPITAGGGNYSAIIPYGWSGVVTPTLAGYSFSPPSISYNNIVQDWAHQDFTFLRPTTENCVQWRLDDNADSSFVSGSEILGQVFDGGANHTSTLSATVNSVRAFHLNGTNQYVQVAIPRILPSALGNLWQKYAGNPVLSSPPWSVNFGQLTKNPAGGHYFFGCTSTSAGANSVYRWSSFDLINWTNRTLVLPNGGPGAWDSQCHVASAFRKPDGTWAMLYRGYDGSKYRMGKAVSNDGTNWQRVGGGPSTQFGANYDPVGIMLVGDTYYVWVNGDGGHGVQHLYTSHDFETFTRYPISPVFPAKENPGEFCPGVWYYDGYYYLLIPIDFVVVSSTLYDHALALYRSSSPAFEPANREFLGYPIVNDQPYDARYLDTPSVPVMDVSRTYSNEFSNTLYCLYWGCNPSSVGTQNLAYTPLDKLVALKPKLKNLCDERISYSFWVQFDTLSTGNVVFSVGSSRTTGSPVQLCTVKSKGADKVLALYLNGAHRLGNIPLHANTPYHMVIVDDRDSTKLYINGVFDDLQSTQRNASTDDSYLFMGAGYGGYLDGYIWDFRIYPQALLASEIDRLYQTSTIVDPNLP